MTNVVRIVEGKLIVYKSGKAYVYKSILRPLPAQRLAKRIVQAKHKLNLKYWFATSPVKAIMMRLDPMGDLRKYSPSYKAFNRDKVKDFTNRGIMPFHARRAHWRRSTRHGTHIVPGCFINMDKCPLDVDIRTLSYAMSSYNNKVLELANTGFYGDGSRGVIMMSFKKFAEEE